MVEGTRQKWLLLVMIDLNPLLRCPTVKRSFAKVITDNKHLIYLLKNSKCIIPFDDDFPSILYYKRLLVVWFLSIVLFGKDIF